MDNVRELPCDYELNSSKRLLESLGVDVESDEDQVCIKQVAAAMSFMECLLERQRRLLSQAKDFKLDDMSIEERASWEAKTSVTIGQTSSLVGGNIEAHCCKNELRGNNVVNLFS